MVETGLQVFKYLDAIVDEINFPKLIVLDLIRQGSGSKPDKIKNITGNWPAKSASVHPGQ
jgi:hypothetical protein